MATDDAKPADNKANEEIKSTLGAADDKDDDGCFFFESDHLALKNNSDYRKLLRAVIKLQMQRIQAIKNLDKLRDCWRNALADPIRFVHDLQHGSDLGIPSRTKVMPLPTVQWEKYTVNVEPGSFQSHRTRLKVKEESKPPSEEDSKSEMAELNAELVRGRFKDKDKSRSFNQLWSSDEQRRLEELLLTFPPEAIESRRWDKIAKALGNRTQQQVASRVQKYFIKLARKGLPIPGRMPNMMTYARRGMHRHHRHNRFYFQPSTFLASHEPPVYMSDEEESCGLPYGDVPRSRYEGNDIPESLRQEPEYQELMALRKLRNKCSTAEHTGFQCDRCKREPITGTRWHCTDCPSDSSVDLCDKCAICGYESMTHKTTHRLDPIYHPVHVDQDYAVNKFMGGDYNYLDPNFVPPLY